MTIDIIWDNDQKTIACYKYTGTWTWDELYKAIDACKSLLDTVNHPVDVIIDMQNTRLLPENALSRGSNVVRMTHPNQGIMVVVGANTLVRAIADLYKRIYSRNATRFYMASTLDEAREIIKKEGRSARPSPPAR